MMLETGTKLGPYEILSALGAGGSGEVYRARDAQRMARFEREAQVLASLNHPNIAAIYGLEESNGVRALVMELVEGETLAERISVAAGFSSASAGLKAGATTGERRRIRPAGRYRQRALRGREETNCSVGRSAG